jgi:predicted Zn-dependent peptidase
MTHHESILPNGLTILAEPTPTARSFAAGLFVRTGSRDEPRQINGVSHFLEHMMFKGSESLDAEAMNRIFDEMGAQYNAFTSQEMTAYYAAVLPEFAARTMEHLGQLLRPAIRNADFDTEKNVILEEIAMYEDEPGHRLYEKLMARHFGQHPLGMSILGPADSIRGMTRDAMADYFRRHYGPRNMVLSVTGQFDFQEVRNLAERFYGDWEPVGFQREYAAPAPAAAREDLHDEKLNRRYLMAITPGPSAQDHDRFAARILADIIGDDENGRLYWSLVDPAIAEEADFSTYPHDQVGSFALSIVSDPDRGEQALEIALAELAKIRTDLKDSEVARAKNKLAGSAVLHGESPQARMRSIGGSWVYNNEYRSLEADLNALLAVTPGDIRGLMERFAFEPMTVVTLGPPQPGAGTWHLRRRG